MKIPFVPFSGVQARVAYYAKLWSGPPNPEDFVAGKASTQWARRNSCFRRRSFHCTEGAESKPPAPWYLSIWHSTARVLHSITRTCCKARNHAFATKTATSIRGYTLRASPIVTVLLMNRTHRKNRVVCVTRESKKKNRGPHNRRTALPAQSEEM